MKFSFIVPVFNRENLIKKCIDSIRQQTYNNYEIIIIDDGSTDNTSKIINDYFAQFDNIKYYYQENSGPYNARLTGVSKSTGEYIIFVDSDDWIENNTLDIIFQYINKYKPDIIKYKYSINNNSTNQSDNSDVKLYSQDKEELYQEFINNAKLNSLCDEAIKKELLINIKENKNNLIQGEDALLNYELYSKANSILVIPNILYHYNYSQNSTSKTENVDNIKKCIDSILVLYDNKTEYIKKWKLDNNSNIIKIINDFLDFMLSLVYRLVKNKSLNDDELGEILNKLFENNIYNKLIIQIKNGEIKNKSFLREFFVKKLYNKKTSFFLNIHKFIRVF